MNATAIIFAFLILFYHQITTWLPLFPWNDIENLSRKDILIECITNGILMGLGVFCLFQNNAGFYHYYPLIYYPFLFSGEFFQWWMPYFSKEFAKSKFNFEYEKRFSRTLKLIPHQAGKRTPDANHTILHLLTLIAIVVVFADRLG